MINKIFSVLIAIFLTSLEVFSTQAPNLDLVSSLVSKKIVNITVKCFGFDDSEKILNLKVLNTCSESISEIFQELLDERFPIYTASCYNNRAMSGTTNPSIHAYGTAIDINYLMNPFYIIQEGPESIIPSRCKDRDKDKQQISSDLNNLKLTEKDINAVLKEVIQPEGSDDWFINRALQRKGMITSDQVKIFRKNGFDIWGGEWRQPMDFMHFQCSRDLAYKIISAKNNDEAKKLWDNHLESLK